MTTVRPLPFDPITYEGFHSLESHEGLPFRWMSLESQLSFEAPGQPVYLELWVRTQFDDLSQTLEVQVGDGPPKTYELAHGWNSLSIPLPASASKVRLQANKLVPEEVHPGDGRALGVKVRPAEIHPEASRHERRTAQHRAAIAAARRIEDSALGAMLATARQIRYGSGFYQSETDGELPFRWMAGRAQLVFDPSEHERFFELWFACRYHDLSQTLGATLGDSVTGHALVHGWNAISLRVPSGAAGAVFEASNPIPEAHRHGDPRELAFQVRSPLLHDDRQRHEHLVRQHDNRILNMRETLAGERTLRSFPPSLGIDLTGACNVNPPCVYCSWDFSKAQEGDNVSSPFTVRTLDEMGPIFDNAHKLVNCSIGEPFMKKDIDPLLDSFGERGKLLEIATNGQILTDSNIRKLLGRNVHLLISLDAATPETYARLRNDTFSRIVENVQRLVNAKGGPGHLPIVDLIFMPMRVNVHEAEAFVRLCEELRVDRLVLRPLNLGEGLDLEWERGGYRFEYAKEVLAFDELVRLSGRVAELCRRLDVTLSDQLDFGGRLRQRFRAEYEAGRSEVAAAFESPPAPSAEVTAATASPGPEASDAAAVVAETTVSPAPAPEPRAEGDRAEPGDLGESRRPLCIEPWQSLYVLRRGTLACCYGAPVAGMNEYSEAWNSSVLQEIRGELAEGRFHSYCLKSPDCPIVRKADHAGMPSGPEPGRPHDRGTVVTAAGRLRGWPARAYHLGKRLVTRGLGRV